MYQHVLKKDAAQATKEKICVHALCKTIAENVDRGKFYEAEQYLIDALKSVNELKRMKDSKESGDRIQAFADHMNSQGIAIETVRRAINE